MTAFNPAKHLQELQPLSAFLKEHPGHPVLPSKRRAIYLIHEAADRSFIDCQAAIRMHGRWLIWPRGLENYARQCADKTRQAYTA